MRPVVCSELTEQDWDALIAGEEHPWGRVGEVLRWREKDRLLALRAPGGAPVAVAGAVNVEVEVAASSRVHLQVVGIGSVFVTRAMRGRGLASGLVRELLGVAETMGPDRAMLFCRAELVPFYRRLGFAGIPATVWADQPDGEVEMPLRAMWRALRGSPGWPEGRVDVCGLPF